MKYVNLRVCVALAIAALAGLVSVGCGSEPAETSPDAKDAVALVGGKADSPYSQCELDHLVLWLNDPATDVDTLKDAGVHTRAAKNLIDHRNGADGQLQSADDNYFADVVEVDDVYFVGPVALEQLTQGVSSYCDAPYGASAEAIFSPQPYHLSHLARVQSLIDTAEHSLDIAMYSFRDQGIFESIEDAVARGVSVRMIFHGTYDDRNDPQGSMSAKLEDAGVTVRWVNKVMHHKFVIVDGARNSLLEAPGATVVTGSANWSYSAGTRYDENTVIIESDAELALRFQREFNHLWAHSRPFDWNDDLEFFESLPIEEAMIPDHEGVDAKFTSANFRTYYSSRYGNTFGMLRGRSEVSSRLVELIEEATDSIWIASGHLRSRPISEALLQKWQDNPDMDIRVYLDGQEYISEWYHGVQEDDLVDCLEEAGDSEAQRDDCLKSGFYFSYELQRAGMPLRFKYYSYRWHYTYAVQMHHKYLIFDGDTVATGSYNLSDNAEHNTMENLKVLHASRYPNLVDAYRDNFTTIWETGRADGVYDHLTDQIDAATSQIPIVFDSMALTWQEVTDLKELIRQTCPAINGDDYRDDPENHEYCYLD
jgi:phosphatidylserine/phosphatidylglycerophosphate/cardiolipin synthase-like enzyme